MDDNSTDCWASDAAARNGKYYFYFSDRKRGIGVMTSDSPSGKYTDALGKPLVSPMHDPTILVDDDNNKTPYIVYGDKEGGGFHIARLKEDMISLAENPKPIKISGKEWENAPHWMDKNYIFKRNGKYYLSWGRDYAISENIYGPYESKGSVGNGHNLSEFAHGSFFEWKGQFYHIWCYYIRPGFKYRESIITYCHIDDDGHIVTDTDFLDKHFENGVGQYNSSWDKIQSEWYYEISPEIVKKGNLEDGFRLINIKNESWIRFAQVDFKNTPKQLEMEISSKVENGKIEIVSDNLSGKVIGTIHMSDFDDIPASTPLLCKLKKVKGKKDIYFKFITDNESAIEMDWFRFIQ